MRYAGRAEIRRVSCSELLPVSVGRVRQKQGRADQATRRHESGRVRNERLWSEHEGQKE
jgi:hypothetical protein